MSKELDCFTTTKWSPCLARLMNIFIFIYHNNSGMTLKLCAFQIILVPSTIRHYCDATFLFKIIKLTAAHSVINVNNKVKLTVQKLANQPSNSLNKVNLTLNVPPVVYSMNCL